jgi:catechol 2,3-dioxygenase-like lactoylglutathione lyase family enzyme
MKGINGWCIKVTLLLATIGIGFGVAVNVQALEPVTEKPWREAVISVTDPDVTARFFKEIGGFQELGRGALTASELAAWGLDEAASGDYLLLQAPMGGDFGHVRLVRFSDAGRRVPMRPGARAWDTGCYFSLMIRVKDMQAIYDDAIRLGWWTETPITALQFGESDLRVVIYRGPDGVQVQTYERLAPALPAAIPEFERMTAAFNIMQMVADRDRAYDFFTEVLGFDTFYKGKPYTAKTPTPTPIGIPINLTTTVPYRAGIVYPVAGEFGRMEMIEVMGLDGFDYSQQCEAPNLGILAVRYPVQDIEQARATILERGGALWRDTSAVQIGSLGAVDLFSVKTPDGAIIQFFEGP